VAQTRLLVPNSRKAEFTDAIAAAVGALVVGDPADPATQVGPLTSARQRERVEGYIAAGRDQGATVAVGGGRPAGFDRGWYVEPTVFADVDNGMRIAQEEIFGPVLTVIPFEDEAEALRIANGVRYGLAGYLWTGDVGRANRVAQALDVGMVWVNSENVRHLPTPFGGMKSSGIGRDGGDYSFDFYMETKNVALALGTHAVPRMGV
jgi:5-carboxymethyl-2-hydroxymuconic-semialdehyde dehydrogenase